MRFHIITLFPETFDCYLSHSILGRAVANKKIELNFLNPRDFCDDPHRRIDDKPYGGGPGMVMKALPIIRAWEKASVIPFREKLPFTKKRRMKTILFSPGGRKFTNEDAKHFAHHFDDIILINGRYEGIDHRVVEATGAELISIGDYVLTGGELASMVVIDSVARQIEGVLGTYESLEEERVSSHEVYTRPEQFHFKGREYAVPKVLVSGHHKKIEEWRKER